MVGFGGLLTLLLIPLLSRPAALLVTRKWAACAAAAAAAACASHSGAPGPVPDSSVCHSTSTNTLTLVSIGRSSFTKLGMKWKFLIDLSENLWGK